MRPGYDAACADPEGGMGSGPLLKNHINIWFLSNTSEDPLKNHKATKPAFDVGPSSASQRKAIEMVFRWRADDGPHKIFWISACAATFLVNIDL